MGCLLDLVFVSFLRGRWRLVVWKGEDRLGAIMGDDGRALGVEVVVVMICAGMTVVHASLLVRNNAIKGLCDGVRSMR